MRQRYAIPLLLSIAILGALLRAHQLGLRFLWKDEAAMYWIAQGGLARVLEQNASTNSAPPLFPVLLAMVSHIGQTEIALRTLPWLAGTLAIPAIYFLALRFLSQAGALVAALFLALAASQIKYSQEVREYSLAVLLTILLLIAFLSFLERPTWRRSSVMAAVSILGLFTQYGLALLLLALNGVFAIHILRRRGPRRTHLVRWGLIQAVLLLTALAVVQLSLRAQWQAGGYRGDEGDYLAAGYWTGTSAASAIAFALRGSRDLIGFAFPGLVFALAVYAGALVALFTRRGALLPLVVGLPFGVFIAAGWVRVYPYMGARQDLLLTPLVILVAALGVDYLLQIDRKFIWVALVLVQAIRLAVTPTLDYYASGEKTALGTVLRSITDHAARGDAVYACDPDDPLVAYTFGVRFPQFPLTVRELGTGPRDYLDQVRELMGTHPRVWFLRDPECGETAPFLQYLADHWSVTLVEEKDIFSLYVVEPTS